MNGFALRSKETKEKPIENDIFKYLFRLKIFAWKVQTVGIWDPIKKIYRKSNNPFHLKGVSDILGLLAPGGKMLAIEVKRHGAYPTPEQRTFLEKINADGGLGFVARSVNDVEEKFLEKGIINQAVALPSWAEGSDL